MNAANRARLWVLGGVLLIAALLLGTWFLGVSPRLSEAAAADSTREGVESQNDLHALKVAALAVQFENIDQLRAELSEAQLALPSGYSEPEVLEAMQNFAAAAGVDIMAFRLEAPSVYSAPEVPVLDLPEYLSASIASGNGSLAVIPLIVEVTGGMEGRLAFLSQLQMQGRYTLAHGMRFDEGDDATLAGLGISAQIFALVDGPAILGEALPAEVPATPEPATQG